jgi:D-alanyl-D-alanine carboxypeptidase/D-alanyl-D-alanine-endopeptidase (penicillin-binding protein 4)
MLGIFALFAALAWTPERVAALDADLDALLSDPALHGAHVGVLAVDTASGGVLYARNPDDAFQPASALKLLVGSAALEKLGADFRFRTSLDFDPNGMAAAPRAALELRASGDPTLTAADVAALAAAARARLHGMPSGVAVQVDASAFDAQPYPAGWTWDDFGEDYAPPVSAATMDENVVQLLVSPGAAAGDRVSVTRADHAPMQGIEGMNCASGAAIAVSAETGDPGSDDTLDALRDELNCPTVAGSLPLWHAAEAIAVSVPRPDLALSLELQHDLFPNGTWTPVPAPRGALELAAHESKTLGELLGPRFWIPSDNLFGELLLKELGLQSGGKPGTTDKGIAFETQWLRGIGVDPATVTLADGCGMSQYDRITPRDLVAILQHDWNGPFRAPILDSLPLGGVRGTIEGIAGTAAAGRVYAKTGSMRHVRALAGYLVTQRRGNVTFAFNVDDWLGDYPALAALRARFLSRIVSD